MVVGMFKMRQFHMNKFYLGLIVTNVFISLYILSNLPFLGVMKTCKKCNTYEFNTILQNRKTCQISGSSEIDLLILIFSLPPNKENRDIIRNTWLTYAKNNSSEVRYAFILGLSEHDTYNSDVVQEHIEHEDIMMQDIYESSRNLTFKTLVGLKWATTWCPSARFIMKTDEDVYVNIPAVINTIRTHEYILKTSVVGHCLSGAYSKRYFSKYSVSFEEYPNNIYPPYCAGPGYIMSTKVAGDITQVSEDIPYLFLEDVYIGLCLQKLPYSTYDINCFNWNYSGYTLLFDISFRTDFSFFKSPEVCIFHSINRPYLLNKIWNATLT